MVEMASAYCIKCLLGRLDGVSVEACRSSRIRTRAIMLKDPNHINTRCPYIAVVVLSIFLCSFQQACIEECSSTTSLSRDLS